MTRTDAIQRRTACPGRSTERPCHAPRYLRRVACRHRRATLDTHAEESAREPLVAVSCPRSMRPARSVASSTRCRTDGRFEAIVVDDGSDDGTGDEARAHGAASWSSATTSDRASERRSAMAGRRASLAAARTSPCSRAMTSTSRRSSARRSTRSLPQDADYLQGSRWMAGGRLDRWQRRAGAWHALYSLAFSLLVGRRVTDATNGFRIFRRELLDDAKVDLDQRWLDSYDLEPYVLYRAITRGYRVIEHPVHRRLPRQAESLHEDARPQGLVAAVPPGAPAADRGEAMSERSARALLRRPPDPRDRRRRVRRVGRDPAARRCRARG